MTKKNEKKTENISESPTSRKKLSIFSESTLHLWSLISKNSLNLYLNIDQNSCLKIIKENKQF